MWSITWPWPMRRPLRALGSRYGALVIDSMPPATMTSNEFRASRSCANIAAFIPEPHILFTVVQPAASGSPAPSEAWRAGAWPCPAGSTQPMSTSCTSSGRMRARSTAARIAAAPSSGAAKPLSSPWNAPIGVRERPTMTIGSFCMEASFGSGSARQLVGTHEAARALGELRRERAGLASLGVDLHAGQHADGGNLPGDGVAHLVHEPRDPFAHFEERRAHGHRIPGEELAPVGDVLLHGRHAAPVLFQEGGRDAGCGEEIPGGLVELAHVPHDVHVPHVVAVPRVDHPAIGLEELVHADPGPASAAVRRIASRVSASRRSISCAAGSA